jgi:hypothetical protein
MDKEDDAPATGKVVSVEFASATFRGRCSLPGLLACMADEARHIRCDDASA